MGVSVSAKQQQLQELEEILQKGSVVEVTSDEEGFQDAWFVATVIGPPPPSSSPSSSTRPGSRGKKTPTQLGPKVYIEYQTLYADLKLSKRLRERVHVGFVRPLPPADENPPKFELYDVVDAYYRDGWWTGVITAVLQQSSRFVVTFRNPPDEIEFGPSDLRLHRNWVNGTWVLAGKKKISRLMYSIGTKVEVSLEEGEVWFPATIIKDQGGSFLVEYQTNPSKPRLHKVTVDYTDVRLCPPMIENKNFFLLEKVDAFYDFGWRKGVILKVLADNRYIVVLNINNKKKECEFNESELRPRVCWVDGKWSPASKDVIIPSHEKPEGLVHIEKDATNMDQLHGSLHVSESNSEGKKSEEKPTSSLKPRENQNDELGSGHQNLFNTTTSADCLLSDSGKMLPRFSEKLKNRVDRAIAPLQTYQKTISKKQSEGMFSGFDGPSTDSNGANSLAVSTSGDQLSNSPSWGKKTQRKQQTVDGQAFRSPSSKRKQERPVKLLSRKPESPSGSKEGNGFRNAAEVVEKECVAKEADMSIVIGLECVKMSDTRAGETRQSPGEDGTKFKGDQKKQMNDQSVLKKELQVGENKQKRPRGRPRKILVKSMEPLITEPNGDNAKEHVVVKDCITSEVDAHSTAGVVSMSTQSSAPTEEILMSDGDGKNVNGNQPKQKNESDNTMRMSPASMQSGKSDQASIKQCKYTSKRTKRQSTTINQNSLVQDSSDSTGKRTAESLCILKEVNVVGEEGPDNMLDDQPLSKWFEGMQSPGTADGARTSTARALDQSTESRKRQKIVANNPGSEDEHTNALSQKTVSQSPSVDKSTIISSEPEPDNLPFVKNTTLWAVVESMDAFRKMPQKPHFRPLQFEKESSREGLAIGCMVTFSSTVEKISKLQFDEPREKIDDILDSLSDLESHGFNVQVLRRRIDELLAIKVNHKRSDDQLLEIKSQILKCNLDKTQKDEEIAEVNKQIQELQRKVALLESVKETKDHEIASLQSELLNLEETVRSARSNFEALAARVI